MPVLIVLYNCILAYTIESVRKTLVCCDFLLKFFLLHVNESYQQSSLYMVMTFVRSVFGRLTIFTHHIHVRIPGEVGPFASHGIRLLPDTTQPVCVDVVAAIKIVDTGNIPFHAPPLGPQNLVGDDASANHLLVHVEGKSRFPSAISGDGTKNETALRLRGYVVYHFGCLLSLALHDPDEKERNE